MRTLRISRDNYPWALTQEHHWTLHKYKVKFGLKLYKSIDDHLYFSQLKYTLLCAAEPPYCRARVSPIAS